MKIKKTKSGYWLTYRVRKRCPLCGGKAEIAVFEEAEPYESSYYYAGEELKCLGCGFKLQIECDDEYDKGNRLFARLNLLNKWNKRSV